MRRSTGLFLLSILWFILAALWYFRNKDAVISAIWFCAAVAELILGIVAWRKER